MSKNVRRLGIVATIATLALLLAIVGQGLADDGPSFEEKAAVGEFLYFDENLSEPNGQACASCHLPSAGFVDPDSDLPVSEGVLPHRFGDRNSPSSAYAMYAPPWNPADETGGQFWDGRATGEVLGDPLADQALGPFLNPVEMANPLMRTVINSVKHSDYADDFEAVWGKGILKDTEAAYDKIALSIAAFERTAMFGQFTSKYDYYLKDCLTAGGTLEDCAVGAGTTAETIGSEFFTAIEWAGFKLFMNENNDNDGDLDGFENDPLVPEGAACVLCHVANWTLAADYALPVVEPPWTADTLAEGWIPPQFTDFTYDNLGVPKNWDSPFLYMPPNLNPDGVGYVDLGLGKRIEDADGMFKVMTLRNIDLTAPYAHNGFFETLGDITHFYNTRDDGTWDAPEVVDNVNDAELGALGLSLDQEAAVVEFMKTLSDGWVPPED